MNKSLAKFTRRAAERAEKNELRLKRADRILNFIAEWMDEGNMPHPGTLMPDSGQTLEEAMREYFHADMKG